MGPDWKPALARYWRRSGFDQRIGNDTVPVRVPGQSDGDPSGRMEKGDWSTLWYPLAPAGRDGDETVRR